jgi:prevent-host-death family protein
MNWTLAKAKNALSEVVRFAIEKGPQSITVRGHRAAVVLSQADYEQLTRPGRAKDFKAFLLSIPSLEGVDLERDQTPSRDFEF